MGNTLKALVFLFVNMKALDTNSLINQLCDREFAILDDFLDLHDFNLLYRLIEEYHYSDHLLPARIGPTQSASRSQDIRRDKIRWIETEPPEGVIVPYYTALKQLMSTLNENLYLGLYDLEIHFAMYQPGDFYKLHVDQFQSNKSRQISCVLYLNEPWLKVDGGELELYDAHHNPLATIWPEKNRFVCFRSHLPHEVKLTHEKRYSITGWLKTR